MPATLPPPEPELSEARFEPSRATLLVDGFMTQFIKVGGVLVIAAVLGIFVFILSQIIPLFQGAKVKPLQTVQLPDRPYSVIGVDEWAELPFVVSADGKMQFIALTQDGKTTEIDLATVANPAPAAATTPPPAEAGALVDPAPPQPDASAIPVPAAPAMSAKLFSAISYNARMQELALGSPDGRVSIVSVKYATSFAEDGSRIVGQKLEAAEWLPVGAVGAPIIGIDVGDASDSKLIGVIQQVGDRAEVHAVSLTRKRSLLGGGKLALDKSYDLTPQLTGKPVQINVNSAADAVVIVTAEGDVEYFFKSGDQFERRQVFKPFGDLEDPTVASIDFLFGDVSLVATSIKGKNRVFSLYRQPGSDVRTFGQTKEFEALPGAATFYTSSLRNKAFLTGTSEVASLRYSTTETVRWQEKMPFTIERAIISGKYNRILFLDKDNRMHLYSLDDPHPETSWRALFGKVWYEGYSHPAYEWQSTGGTDDFEPKFSLIPLIIGTLKGTLYAMVFAVPIALTAALYASQFLHSRFRAVVKPIMEIMASLPSVVLGFLAALWLAPLIETRVPSVILMVIAIPAIAFVFGYIWSGLPFGARRLIPAGYEFIVFLPIVLFVVWVCWHLGPQFEKFAFVVTDPATGAQVADFRQWWPQATGADFQQRNSLVVGFVMGFAVIPIIFTIADDALSNVPLSLRSASLALGATRWQTAKSIVLPTASAGIFSALMIGLGRAVGETMIVVMATGNTPIMDFNIFSGMRTLSANIAVELPEAPVGGTFYRTLFLGAMLLFLATFLVNTIAEIMRQRLREKYKTV